ncbi:hypothetical protein EYF80_012257 [Liparis tanakae]|uniref:Uncharacterized protein n=1 Tax=Liparis tanakae TaxID=230148 RepID=A0A4Z2IJV9_9TELE|nr:hypothetical protein EYF80_012257 [Liparis tanakae]
MTVVAVLDRPYVGFPSMSVAWTIRVYWKWNVVLWKHHHSVPIGLLDYSSGGLVTDSWPEIGLMMKMLVGGWSAPGPVTLYRSNRSSGNCPREFSGTLTGGMTQSLFTRLRVPSPLTTTLRHGNKISGTR